MKLGYDRREIERYYQEKTEEKEGSATGNGAPY
jgi:hypothetical protein